MNFKVASQASGKMREHNDCAVKAFSIASGKSYEEVHGLFKSLGRRDRKATPHTISRKVAHILNPEVKFVSIRKPDGSKYTARTIGNDLRRGRFVVLYRGHLAALVDGVIHDWTDGRCHRVLGVYKL